MAQQPADVDVKMDGTNLYQEETFTDRRIGSLLRLTPVTLEGARDESRPILFVGQTQVLTPAGALPISFEIDASTLEEALAKFGDLAQEALASTVKRLEEMRRDAASSLIVPGSGAGGGAPGGGPMGGSMGPGGAPGGGIKLP